MKPLVAVLRHVQYRVQYGVQYKLLSIRALHMVCFVLAYLLMLIVQAPASLVSIGILPANMTGISLLAASGHLWKGEAQVWLQSGQGQLGLSPDRPEASLEDSLVGSLGVTPAGTLPDTLAGTLSGTQLGTLAWDLETGLSGQPGLHLRWNGQPAGLVRLKLHGFGQLDPQLQQLAFSLPADALGKLSPLLMPLGLQGRIIVECPHFDFNARGWHGTLQARLEQVQSSLSPVKPLGNYQLTLIADGQKAALAVQTLQGPLQLQGAGQLTLVPDTGRRFSITRPAMPSALTISGLASTDSEHQQALQALLRVLGNPLDQTRFSWGYTWQAG